MISSLVLIIKININKKDNSIYYSNYIILEPLLYKWKREDINRIDF